MYHTLAKVLGRELSPREAPRPALQQVEVVERKNILLVCCEHPPSVQQLDTLCTSQRSVLSEN